GREDVALGDDGGDLRGRHDRRAWRLRNCPPGDGVPGGGQGRRECGARGFRQDGQAGAKRTSASDRLTLAICEDTPEWPPTLAEAAASRATMRAPDPP